MQKIYLFIFCLFLLTKESRAQHPWTIKDVNQTGSPGLPVGANGSIEGFSRGTMYYEANGVAFFHANDGVHGNELWKTDGTATGTTLVRDITPGEGSTQIQDVYSTGNLLYFTVNSGTTIPRVALWRSDGTAAGTYQLMSNNKHLINLNTSTNRFF